jgi:hypothetical protein
MAQEQEYVVSFTIGKKGQVLETIFVPLENPPLDGGDFWKACHMSIVQRDPLNPIIAVRWERDKL